MKENYVSQIDGSIYTNRVMTQLVHRNCGVLLAGLECILNGRLGMFEQRSILYGLTRYNYLTLHIRRKTASTIDNSD